MRAGQGAGLFNEQGTGKTIITLAVLERCHLADVLIVCPLSAVDLTWGDRLATMPQYKVCRSIEEFRQWPGTSRVLLIHFQLLSKIIKKLRKIPWSLVIIDESQQLKGRSSGWSRAARMLRNVERRIALSGTPVDKSPIDVWAQMRFINHKVLGENWGDFADDWCNRGGFMNKQWVFNNKKMPRFLETLQPHIYRLTDEFLKLPPTYVHLRPVELLGAQRRYYRAMHMHNIVRLDSGEVIKADLPITRDVKKEQIVNGFILDEDGQVIRVGRAKERKFVRLLEEVPTPFVVCCKLLEDIDCVRRAIEEHTDYSYEVICGDTRDSRTDQIKGFQSGKTDVLICQIRTGGVSVEYTRANQLIVYSMNHSFIDFDQFRKRLHRYGQKHPVHIHLIYAQDTIDEEKIKVVERKAQDAKLIVSAFERRPPMAKAAKKASPAKKKAAPEKAAKNEAPAFDFGVPELAEKLGVSEATTRMKLRNAGIEKEGGQYGWNKTGFDRVVKDLKSSGREAEA